MDIYKGVRRKDELQKLQNVRKVEHSVPAAYPLPPRLLGKRKKEKKKEKERERI